MPCLFLVLQCHHCCCLCIHHWQCIPVMGCGVAMHLCCLFEYMQCIITSSTLLQCQSSQQGCREMVIRVQSLLPHHIIHLCQEVTSIYFNGIFAWARILSRIRDIKNVVYLDMIIIIGLIFYTKNEIPKL